MGLKIDEIRSFVAVAETGSFSAAARNLKRAQSVVSMHIAGFEAELGYKLFDRTPKPVLTAQGRELLVGAKRVLVEADRLQNRALTLSETQTPSIYMGIDLVLDEARSILSKGGNFVLLGSGERELEQKFEVLRSQYPDTCGIYIGYNDQLAHKIYAGSDFFLMPSLFEPCGLSQMIAQRYGTLPIVRKTGGLADTIVPYDGRITSLGEDGIAFEDYNIGGLDYAIYRAEELYRNQENYYRVAKVAMKKNYSWSSSAGKYLKLYQKALSK